MEGVKKLHVEFLRVGEVQVHYLEGSRFIAFLEPWPDVDNNGGAVRYGMYGLDTGDYIKGNGFDTAPAEVKETIETVIETIKFAKKISKNLQKLT